MKTCKKCGTEYQENFNNCPNCGSSKTISEKDIAEKFNSEEIKEGILKKRKQQQMILLSLGVAAVIIIITVIAGISSAINKPKDEYNGLTSKEFNTENKELLEEGKEEFENNNYEDALEALFKVDSQYKKYDEAQTLIGEATYAYIDDVILKADNYISKEEYDKALGVIAESKSVVDGSSEIDDTMSRILDEFRADYVSQAEELEASGDYEGAIRLLENSNEVFDDDMVIENKVIDLTNMYKMKFLDDAATYLNDNNYNEAINVLESAQLILGEEDIDSALVNAHIIRVKDEVKTYEDNKDYAGGIVYLEKQLDDVDNDAEIVQKLNSLKNNYRSELLLNAETKFSEEGYAAAIALLEQGIEVLGADNEINVAIKEYEEYAPVDLLSMESFSGNGLEVHKGEKIKLNDGTELSGYYQSQVYKGDSISYIVDDEYSRITGIFGVPFETRESDQKGDTLTILADGEPIFVSDIMKAGELPVYVDLNIAGCNELEIVVGESFLMLVFGDVKLWQN